MDGRLLKTLSLLAVMTMTIVGVVVVADSDGVDAADDGEVIPSDNSAFRLTFHDYEGGTESEMFFVRQGYPVELPTNLFTRDGYVLTGWTDGTNSYLTGQSVTINEELQLYGVWTEVSGTHLDDVVLEPGEPYSFDPHSLSGTTGFVTTYSIPSWLEHSSEIGEPTYSGYTMQPGCYLVYYSVKWVSNPTYWWFTITVPSEMDTEVEITFDVGEEVTGSIPTQYARIGTGIILPGADSLEWTGSVDKKLVGWHITDNRGNRGVYALESLYIFEGDAVIVPEWSTEPKILVYSLDGGSLDNVYATIIYGDQPQPLETNAEKPGHEFLGWKVTQDRELVYAPGMLATLTDTTYVEAYFVPEGTSTFTLTYDAGQGAHSAIKTQKVEAGKYVMLQEKYQVQKDGYEFVGWSTQEPTGDGVDDGRPTIGSPQYRITDNVTLYAVYTDPNAGETDPDEPEDPDDPNPDPEPNVYTVVFDANGGDMSYPIQNVVEGGLVEEPSDPMRNGMIFLGWAVLGTTDPWDFNTDTVQFSITLRAMWDELFSIAYSTDSEGLPVVTVTVNDTYKGAPSIEVYWGSGNDGSSTVVNGTASHTYQYTTWGYIVLTIQWEGQTHTSRLPFQVEAEHYVPVNEYLVTFDTDGGSHVDPQKVKHGSTAVEPVAPTKNGFNFNGWVDSNGEPFDFNTPIYSNTVLRAVWTDQPVIEDPDDVVVFFTISKTSSGWTLDGSKSQNVDTWTWLLDDTEIGTGMTFDLDSDDVEDGTHTIQLKAIGTDGETYHSGKQTITKGGSSQNPIHPRAFFTIKETEAGWTCDASSSTNATKYEWHIDGKLISGEYGPTLDIDKDELKVGTHEIKLIVTSSTNNTHEYDDQITVEAPEEPEEDGIDWVLVACVVLVIVVLAIVVWRFML